MIGTLAHNLRRCYANAPATSSRGLLAWARHYLPAHFQLPPSAMHRWLAEQIERGLRCGQKINVIGPRGAGESDRGIAGLSVAVGRRNVLEPYIWIVSDTNVLRPPAIWKISKPN